jgi:hypothetical protein
LLARFDSGKFSFAISLLKRNGRQGSHSELSRFSGGVKNLM